MAILQDAKEFVAASPLPNRRRPSLDPHNTPFGSAGSVGSADFGDELLELRSASVPGLPGVGPPRRLPALSMEAFAAMKRREGLESRCSDPGARGSARGGSRTRRRHAEGGLSGAKSAPASRGTEGEGPLTPMWPPDAPLTEPPDRRHTSKSPFSRPHSTVNLGGMTPLRCSSTTSLHQSDSRSRRPPGLPKQRSTTNREQERRVYDVSPSASPMNISDDSPSAPSEASPTPGNGSRRNGSASASAWHPSHDRRQVGRGCGYPHPAVPELPLHEAGFAAAAACHSGRNSGRSGGHRSGRSAHGEHSCARLRDDSPRLQPRMLAADIGAARTDRSTTVVDDACAHASDAAVVTEDIASGPARAPSPVISTSVERCRTGASSSSAAPPTMLADLCSEVGEASYGWDAGESEEASLAGTLRNGGLPLTCTRGPRGVTSLTMSTTSLATGRLGDPVDTQGCPAPNLGETLSAPDTVKGTGCSWVRGEVIGHGCLGSVFKALNQQTGQIFAVKEVRIDNRDNEDVKFKRALENEVSIYKELHHPRIVSYLGHDDIGSSLYIYLEYMPGGSITQVLSQFGCFEEPLTASYCKDILEGLDYLHTQNPVCLHRDVKGANILVGLDCRAKLSDFGCSKRTADTLSQSLRGSIPWMAPEVIQQTGYGRRSDVWSLGCVAIEMATAKHPWGTFDNPMAAMVKIGMSKETPPLPDNLSELGRDFIRQCTQRDKNLRPTATKLLEHEFVRELHNSF
eukprot:TRINITY_DN21394_c0_g1_i1.p1 TRINITY_DN21394_c0_g1~~TRINITY_DN21394_c0_g1_i1.p1  ORF type:complete len:798 (-),score=66.39 TRINITY_DN21394_c0_g1_i1:60-2288(-)